MPGTSAGTGQPLTFRCWAQRRLVTYPSPSAGGRFPTGHERIRRTGRTRKARGKPGRMMKTSHEYVCECGHIGWSKHRGVLRYKLENEE